MMVEQPPAIVEIVYERGGNLGEQLAKIDGFQKRGVEVRINGVCASGCTLVTKLPEGNVCVTSHARLVFHQVLFPTGERNDLATKFLMDQYPYWVRAWIASKGRGVLGPGYIVMGFPDLTKHYSICSGDIVARQ
jgi:hypothetical protein